MATIISVASGKGGVGKTLVTASLALALSRTGASVLAVDGDMGLRNLDLAFGLQDDVLYDAVDLMKNRCPVCDALVSVMPGVDFLAASQKKTWEKIHVPSYLNLLEHLSDKYDYVLVDCPPGRGQAYKNAVALADQILFVLEPTWTSMRDGGRLMRFCDKHKFFDYSLVFNNFYQDRDGYISCSEMIQVLDPEHIAGLLPHDEVIHAAMQNGTLPYVPQTNPFVMAMDAMARGILTDEEPELTVLETYLPAETVAAAPVAVGRENKLTLRQRRRESVSWRRIGR